jgi:hypothetical protein
MWTRHESYDNMLVEAWNATNYHGSSVQGVWERLKEVSSNMQRWSYESFGSVQKEIKRLRAALVDAKAQALVSNSLVEVKTIEAQLHELFTREEIMYRQRSRQEWLKAGDRNTIFFSKSCLSPEKEEHSPFSKQI